MVSRAAQFKNSGAEAGATQQHPHSQLIGFPVVPAHTKELLSAARAHHEVNGTCVHCRMVERLRQASEEGGSGKELLVYQNDEFVSPAALEPMAPSVTVTADDTLMLEPTGRRGYLQLRGRRHRLPLAVPCSPVYVQLRALSDPVAGRWPSCRGRRLATTQSS